MRRIKALVGGLPRDSALLRHLDPEGSQWNNTTELLASLIEVVDFSNRLYIVAHAKKGAKAPEPIKVRRPGEKEREESRVVSMSSPEARAFFGGGQVAFVPPSGVEELSAN